MSRKLIAWLGAAALFVLHIVISATAASAQAYPTGTITTPRCGAVKVEFSNSPEYGKPASFEVRDATNGIVLGAVVLPDANGAYTWSSEFTFAEDTGWRVVELWVDQQWHIGARSVPSACSNPSTAFYQPWCTYKDYTVVPTRLNSLKSRVYDTYVIRVKGSRMATEKRITVRPDAERLIPAVVRPAHGGKAVITVRVNGELLGKRSISSRYCVG